MFASKRERTVIAEGLRVVGTITSEGLVEVNGTVEGDIHCTAVVIHDKAHIIGNIKAATVSVGGMVEGVIECGDAHFNAQAKVLGDVECETIVVEKGAFMRGHLTRRLKEGEADTMAQLLDRAGSTPEDLERKAGVIAEGEEATRKAELIVEARALSGNPDLAQDEALVFLAKRGNRHARKFVEKTAAEPRLPANGRF